VTFALGDDCGLQPATEIIGEFVEGGVTVDFNGALGGVADDVTVVAPLQVFLEFCLGFGVHGVVEVIG
jgi:hypothetical protein